MGLSISTAKQAPQDETENAWAMVSPDYPSQGMTVQHPSRMCN